jgi:hypothetical protein
MLFIVADKASVTTRHPTPIQVLKWIYYHLVTRKQNTDDTPRPPCNKSLYAESGQACIRVAFVSTYNINETRKYVLAGDERSRQKR